MNTIKEVAIKCLQDESQAILNLIPQLDENFEHSVDIIMQCSGKVIVTGVGKSGHIGAKLAATLSSTGTPAFFINPLDVFHGDLGVMTSSDVVIAISNSGQTDELLRFIPYVLEHNIPLIGISGNPTSLLAKYSTCHIAVSVNKEACPLNLAPTSSTTATLAMGDALACALIEKRKFKAKDFAVFHPGGSIGKRLLTTARDVMRTTDLPKVETTTTLGDAIIDISKGKLGLCVVIDQEQVMGIITDGDVRRAMEKLHDKFFNVPVSDIMTKTPKCVTQETRITKIQAIMHRNKIHAVLVVDDNRHLIGIVDNFSCML